MDPEKQELLEAIANLENEKTRLFYEEMHQYFKKTGDRKILRQQLQLLAEYSRRPCGNDHVPEASEAMLAIYKELLKGKCLSMGLLLVLLFAGCNLLHRFHVKGIKLFH